MDNIEEQERKYLHEFKLKSCKFVRKMEDFEPRELKYWRQIVNAQFYVKIDEDEDIDFFDDNVDNLDFYQQEIRIMTWSWKGEGNYCVLTDINGWPGDSEVGSIYLNGGMMLKNDDTRLSQISRGPKDFVDRIQSFQHLRTQRCCEMDNYDDNHAEHKHCEHIREKYEKFTQKNIC